MKQKQYRFDTQVIHAGQKPEDWERGTQVPIYQTAAHRHDTAQSLSDSFKGDSGDHIYARLTNPTNNVLEEKLKVLEGGKGAIVTGSGMAAVTNACMAMLRTGDTFISSNSLFLSTEILFKQVFSKYAITPWFVDPSDLSAIENLINEKTRFIYLETIGNPGMEIPNIEAVATLAHVYNLPLIVDNTLASPYLCRPIELGADVVIHSTTKYLSGHGNAPGGVIIDAGTFDWQSGRFPDFEPFVEKKGNLALLDKIWREHQINFGTTQAPFHSYLTAIGLETLALRMQRHLENAEKVAKYLKEHPKVAWVNWSGFSDHPSHETATKLFKGKGYGAMMAFGLKDQQACFEMIDQLKLIYHLANLGDCKTLIIHPWSTQYVNYSDEAKTAAGVSEGLIRLSVGIENADDIIDDFEQALAAVSD